MRLYFVFLMPNNKVLVKHQNERTMPSEQETLDYWLIRAHNKDEALGIIFTRLHKEIGREQLT